MHIYILFYTTILFIKLIIIITLNIQTTFKQPIYVVQYILTINIFKKNSIIFEK